jgi:hypothetical protein
MDDDIQNALVEHRRSLVPRILTYSEAKAALGFNPGPGTEFCRPPLGYKYSLHNNTTAK